MEEMRLDFKNQTVVLAEKFKNTVSTTIDEKLKPIVQENATLKKEIVKLQSKVQSLEREARKNNILIHGFKESETNTEELRKKLLEVLNEVSQKAGFRKYDEWEISDLRRIGKKDSKKTRPILATFTLVWRKYELLKNSKNFPTGMYATEDYPKDVMIKRKELKDKQMLEMMNGNKAIIRYDKLIIISEKDKESKRKRKESNSPPNTPQGAESGETATYKINKVHNFFRSRTSSTNSTGK